MAQALVALLLIVTTVVVGRFHPTDVNADSLQFPENGQGSLFFVGDSLTVGTKAFGSLQKRLDQLQIWDQVIVNAKVGRRTDQSLRLLSTAMPDDTSAIVIALGTNDVITRREPKYPAWVIDQVMEASGGLPVLWFNTEFSPTGRGDWRFRSRRFNRALREAREEWPNLVIADWYTYFTPRGKNRFQADGVHLSVSAYKVRASFTETQVRRFGQSIVDATTTTAPASTTTTTTTIAPTSTISEPTTTTTTPQSTTTSP